MASMCIQEGGAYVQCRAMDTTGKCSACPPIDFDTIQTTFPDALKQQFMVAMSSGMPDSPEFCMGVETNVCANYEATACCCEPEMAAWQKCIIARDLAVSVGQQNPCDVNCVLASAGGGGGGGGGGGSMMAVIIVVVLIIIAGGGGGFFIYRKRQANNNTGRSKRKGKNKKKSSSDDSDDDSFKDEKVENNPKKKGLFSMFVRGNETVTGSDTDSEEFDKKKRKGSPKIKKDKSKKRHAFDNLVGEDIEGGMISDVSSSQEDIVPKSHRKKRYEETEDSITDAYGSAGYNKHGSKGYGSRNAYDDDVSDLENRDLEPRRTRSYGNDLPERISNTKKISSRELKNLMRNKDESDRRMTFLEEEMKSVENRLARKDREANDLRRDRDDQDRRIRELEAMNARLQQEAVQSRGRRGGGGDDHYQDGSGNGYNSRSKASISEEEESYHDDRRSGTNRNAPRGRPNSSKSVGRSNSGRDLRRSNSGRSLNRDRDAPRRPVSRSPSSTRGLGKQASSMRRDQRDRSGGRNTSHTKSHRSKSPRSYLHNEER